MSLASHAAGQPADQVRKLPLLTSISAIRALTMEESRKGYPVKVRGTVTIDLQSAWLFFMQERDHAIYLLRPSTLPENYRLGDRLEVTGVTAPGGYSPLIVIEHIQLLKHGPLPPPEHVGIRDLLAAESEGRWVQIEGKIESAQAVQFHKSVIPGTDMLLDIMGHHVRVVVAASTPSSADPQSLIDAEVRVQGVVGTSFNTKGQLTSVRLDVPGFDQVQIIRPPPADPWKIPEQKISELLQYHPYRTTGSRVRVVGQVTYFEPGQLLVIDNDRTGLIVQTAQRGKLALGDYVEVLGRPVLGGYTPVLGDAVFRKTRPGLSIVPEQRTPEELLTGDFDADLVRTDGELVGRQHTSVSTILSFRSGQIQFTATLAGKHSDLDSSKLENGSRLRVTGICRVAVISRDVDPQAFGLQLRSADDIRILARPSWWTPQKLGIAIFGMFILILLVFGWGWSLRRRVSQQTSALAASEREFRDLFEGSPVGIYRASPEGRILLANPTLTRMLGYAGPEDFNAHSDDIRVGSSGWKHRDGTLIPMRENSHAVTDKTGALLYREGTVEDITEQCLRERRDLDRKRIFEMLARNEPLPDILGELALAVERQFPGGFCCIMLRSDEGQISPALSVGAAPTLPRALRDALHELQIGPVSACCGSAVYWNRVIESGDLVTDPLWDGLRDAVILSGLRSCCSIPIASPVASGSGESAGALAMYRPHPNQASKAEIELLQSSANLAGVAIKHHDLYQQLAWRAEHDALTGLANRRLFESHLQNAVARAQATGSRLAVFGIDLDRFKQINDTFGHHVGDLFLQQAAQRLQNGLRKGDTLARMGGDEFAAVLENVNCSDDAREVAEKLAASMRRRFDIGNCELFGGASIGISMFPEDGADSEDLQRNADAALYRAKREGKSRVEFFSALAHSQK